MGLRQLLQKGAKNEPPAAEEPAPPPALDGPSLPEFTFLRSDTFTQEVIQPPTEGTVDAQSSAGQPPRRSLDVFGTYRSRSASVSSQASQQSVSSRRRLSQLFLFGRQPDHSNQLPDDLPAIGLPDPADSGDKTELESRWEQRATLLAGRSEVLRRPSSPSPSPAMAQLSLTEKGPDDAGPVPASSPVIDSDIQEAIRLHETGQLEKSTVIFRRLADPAGPNNPLSQVLYGLALRHGWGCAPDPEGAVVYLSAAASNAAFVEQAALQAGLKKGGAAKGELVLAIFELANCFRHGWGISKDAVAAKQYYETAANLGDTDAMNEAAWCYLEGFGCKKDKFAAARYYRLAEKAGSKTLGNTWIWKAKYDTPPAEGAGKR